MGKKKVDFYSGKGSGLDYMLRNFINGLYFNPSTKSKEPLSTKVNKYNRQIIAELSALSSQYRTLIAVYSLIDSLLREHQEHSYGDTRNIQRLLHAQSGTIKVNYIIKSALKKYAIDKQDVYDFFKKEVATQKDRVRRNKELVLEMLKEYGMNNLAETIHKDTGLDLFDHYTKFTDKKLEDTILLNEEDANKFYDKVRSEYIAWLKELADKYNVRIYDDISESLAQNRKVRQEMAQNIRENNRLRREAKKQADTMQAISQDNAYIQQDIDSTVDIAEFGAHGQKLGRYEVLVLRNKLWEFKGTIYYIAVSKSKAVKYLGENGSITASIIKAKKFTLIENAQQALKDEDVLSEYDVTQKKVMSLTVSASDYTVGDVVKKLEARMSDYNEEKDEPYYRCCDFKTDKQFMLKIIKATTGPCSWDKLCKAIVYVCDQHKDRLLCRQCEEYSLGTENDQVELREVTEENNKRIRYKDYTFSPRVATFDMLDYQNIIKRMRVENTFIQRMLYTDGLSYTTRICKEYGIRPETIELRFKFSKYMLQRFKLHIKMQHANTVYYIVRLNFFGDFNDRSIKYVGDRRTPSSTLTNAKVYSNLAEAVADCKQLNDEDTNYIHRVLSIDASGLLH